MGVKNLEKKLKELEESQFKKEVQNNEDMFKTLVKTVRPDLYVLMDILDTTGVNPYVVFHIVRQLYNIALGNKYGSVTTSIENGVVTFVRGEESTKLNESLLRKVS